MRARRIVFGTVLGTVALTVGVVGAQVVVQPSPPPPVIVEPAPPASVIVKPTPPPTVVVEPTPSTTVIETTPSTTTVVVPPAVPQMIQAAHIEANDVRAETSYANKIKATDVKGTIHQSREVKMKGQSNLKVPSLVASVIYADTIKANSVTATNIYVRDLDRR